MPNIIEAEVSVDTQASTHIDPDPPSSGIEKERVHPATLEMIHHLFGERGIQFVALLLRHAVVKQMVLPSLPAGGDVAVIEVQSLRVLAQQINWSYDTTEKYALLFCALQIFHKQRQRRSITIHFPLTAYIPPGNTGEELDGLLTKRSKVVSFAATVRRRLARVGQTPGRSIINSTSGNYQSRSEDKRLLEVGDTIQDIRQLLQQKVDSPVLRDELLTGLTGILHYRCRLSHDFVDSELGEAPQKPRESTLVASNGDFYSSEDSEEQQESRPFGQNGDFETIRSLPFAGKKGEVSGVKQQKSTILLQKVDSLSEKQAQISRLSPHTTSESPKTVDSEAIQAVTDHANVNVITIIETINVNVSMVALFCCKALGEVPGKRGIYSKLFREIDFQASAITAALVYTLVHREDGTIRKPPAVFYQRCKDYHREGVPEEAATLVERYGQLSYPKLLEALRRPPTPAVQPVPSPRREAPAYQTPTTLLPITSVKTPLAPRIPLKSGGGMQREDALLLRTQIAGDRRVGLCRAGVVTLADGTYAIIVDHTLTEIVRQVAFYSLHEWETRSASLTAGHELFVPEGQMKPHPLRAFLSKGGMQ